MAVDHEANSLPPEDADSWDEFRARRVVEEAAVRTRRVSPLWSWLAPAAATSSSAASGVRGWW
jgi:hypothetical protein